MRMVDYYLGTDKFRLLQSLHRQPFYAEMPDGFGFLIHNQGEKAGFVIPS